MIKLNLNLLWMLTGGLDLQYFDKDFEETANWDVLGTEMEKRYTPDKASNPNYALVVFKLQLKRKVVFSTYILTLPCVCLAVLTLAVFWLPPDRPDRTTLGRCASTVFTVPTCTCVHVFLNEHDIMHNCVCKFIHTFRMHTFSCTYEQTFWKMTSSIYYEHVRVQCFPRYGILSHTIVQ